MKNKTLPLTIALFAFIIGTAQPQQQKGITVYGAGVSSDFPKAELLLKSPLNKASIPAGKDTFDFEVKNYSLGAQTPDAAQKLCANSSKGQHIHFILDNAPYYASYSPQIVREVGAGHHVLLAFLSRSYHESLKHKKAYVLKEFNTGADATDNFNEKAPHLFFSRPKGEYIGENETKKIMLDFYLVNCKLSENGYKVRATINGTPFMLTTWQPYIIEGLPLGTNKIKLELLNKAGKPVDSPYNGTERTFKLITEPSAK